MFNGKKVAFIATGGGGKAITHAGVLQACHEMNIGIDFIIGASAGAIAGIFYSQHKNLDMLVDNFRPADKRKYKFKQFGWKRMFSIKNFFSPGIINGLFDLSSAEEFFRKTLPINEFSQLDLPVYIAATNLEENDGELFGPGIRDDVPISKVLVASCCIPGLFRPVKIGNGYYVDGEIKRPLSIQAAIDLGAEIIIVSDTYALYVKDAGTSGVFNIMSLIINMLFEDKSIRAVNTIKAKYPERDVILIAPTIGDISSFDTGSYDKLVSRGYKAAMKEFKKYMGDDNGTEFVE